MRLTKKGEGGRSKGEKGGRQEIGRKGRGRQEKWE
jgi:hypothetical protein